MDRNTRYNQARWEDLARNRVQFSEPWLDLDQASARERTDPHGLLGEVDGKDVLCLCGGGGQQAPAFALLGGRVTTHDFCATQLERDREAAAHYGVTIDTRQGDMRDLSRYDDASFDVVYHAHSITFVPDPVRAFAEAARVLRPGGMYYLHFGNPAFQGIEQWSWTEKGYPRLHPYVAGMELDLPDNEWNVGEREGKPVFVRGPKEYQHTLGEVLNGLISLDFRLLGLWEDVQPDSDAAPGTWGHFCHIMPPYLELIARYEGA